MHLLISHYPNYHGNMMILSLQYGHIIWVKLKTSHYLLGGVWVGWGDEVKCEAGESEMMIVTYPLSKASDFARAAGES